METIEELKSRIDSTTDLHSIVKTMKAMAAVKITQYEKAVAALEDYYENVEMGFRVVIGSGAGLTVNRGKEDSFKTGAVVFGSDQGMCGQLNDLIASKAVEELKKFSSTHSPVLMAAGERVGGRLLDAGMNVSELISMPGSVNGIVPGVNTVLSTVLKWYEQQGTVNILLFHSSPVSGARYAQKMVHLLPLDKKWLERIKKKKWPTNAVPQHTMDRDRLFSFLVRQYLFSALYRAFAQSLASENASRLAAMQGAEKNINTRLAELNRAYHQMRQMSITEELLDIVSGFEAMKQDG